ncbi:MAG: hypothetical protein QM539_06330 [Alphaproteobacteria bacterium]|nr:hypothetical protein [Alphaproteobacteria bacterium]
MKTKFLFYLILIYILNSCDIEGPIKEIVYKNNTDYKITILSIRTRTVPINFIDTGKIIILPSNSVELIYSYGPQRQLLSVKSCRAQPNCLIENYDTLKIIFDNTKVQKCYIGGNYYSKNTFCDYLLSNYTFTQTDYDSAEFINP